MTGWHSHLQHKKAIAAGHWTEEDKGLWVRRTVVWKLQVGLHRDTLDKGALACFLCGSYEGGQLCLPDLGAKLVSHLFALSWVLNILRYHPGDTIIVMASALYHSVMKWEPAPMKNNDLLTPGCVRHVLESLQRWGEKTKLSVP